jgi:hypothetical protein
MEIDIEAGIKFEEFLGNRKKSVDCTGGASSWCPKRTMFRLDYQADYMGNHQ